MKRLILAALATVLVLALPAAFGAGIPKGLYASSSTDYAAMRPAGVGFVTTSAYRIYLDKAHAAGLRVVAWLGGYSQSTCSFNWSDEKVRARVAEIKGHPALLVYFIDDEPHASDCASAPAQIRARSKLIKSLDPAALTLITENRYADFDELAGATDLMGIVMYPCNHSSSSCKLSKIDERVKLARSVGVDRIWGVVQSFGDSYYRMPSPTELAAIIARWKANGVEALLGYTWDDAPDPLMNHPEQWPVWKNA
jgi:hypothetical protein